MKTSDNLYKLILVGDHDARKSEILQALDHPATPNSNIVIKTTVNQWANKKGLVFIEVDPTRPDTVLDALKIVAQSILQKEAA